MSVFHPESLQEKLDNFRVSIRRKVS